MRILQFVAFVLINIQVFAQKKTIQVSGTVILTNNGIDPVPAFALGKPALMSSIFITKGNFIFNTMFNYSITEMKPWSQNVWLLYKIPVSKKSYFRTGLSLSFFHKKENIDLPGFQNLSGQVLNQYPALETSFTHKISEKVSLSLNNWAVRGIEKDAISWGNFTSLSANISDLKLGKSLKFGISPNVFYLKNAAPFKGLFASENATLFYKDVKIGLVSQFVMPISTTPKTTNNWNVGLMWKL